MTSWTLLSGSAERWPADNERVTEAGEIRVTEGEANREIENPLTSWTAATSNAETWS